MPIVLTLTPLGVLVATAASDGDRAAGLRARGNVPRALGNGTQGPGDITTLAPSGNWPAGNAGFEAPCVLPKSRRPRALYGRFSTSHLLPRAGQRPRHPLGPTRGKPPRRRPEPPRKPTSHVLASETIAVLCESRRQPRRGWASGRLRAARWLPPADGNAKQDEGQGQRHVPAQRLAQQQRPEQNGIDGDEIV